MASVKAMRRAAAQSHSNERNPGAAGGRGNNDNERSQARPGAPGAFINRSNPPGAPSAISVSNPPARGVFADDDNTRSNPRQSAAPNNEKASTAVAARSQSPSGAVKRIPNENPSSEPQAPYAQEDVDRGRGQDRWARARSSARKRLAR